MATLSKTGGYANMEVRVYYDSENDRVQLISQDPDLSAHGLRVVVRKGTANDESLRDMLEATGIQSRPFKPSIPGQPGPITFTGGGAHKEVRNRLLLHRTYGTAHPSWCLGHPIDNPSVLTYLDWDRTPLLVVTGDQADPVNSLLSSMLVQLSHNNGPTEVDLTVIDVQSDVLRDYGNLDTVRYTPNATARDIREVLAEVFSLIKNRQAEFREASNHGREVKTFAEARASAINDSLRSSVKLSSHPLYMPHVYVVINGWEHLSANLNKTTDPILEQLEAIQKFGTQHGINVVVGGVTDQRSLGERLLRHATVVALNTREGGELSRRLDEPITALAHLGDDEAILSVSVDAPNERLGLYHIAMC